MLFYSQLAYYCTFYVFLVLVLIAPLVSFRDTRATAEKAKGPSRRSSRTDKEPEEEASDNSQRKRAARPGSASSNTGKGASSSSSRLNICS